MGAWRTCRYLTDVEINFLLEPALSKSLRNKRRRATGLQESTANIKWTHKFLLKDKI